MNTIAPAIKRRRVQLGLTQKDMSDKMHLSEKAWRNIENGVTRLDMERLQEIAEMLETNVIDLINSADTVSVNYAHQDNRDQSQQIGYANEVTVQSDIERGLFERMLADKDEQIRLLREELAGIKVQLNGLIEKVVKN